MSVLEDIKARKGSFCQGSDGKVYEQMLLDTSLISIVLFFPSHSCFLNRQLGTL